MVINSIWARLESASATKRYLIQVDLQCSHSLNLIQGAKVKSTFNHATQRNAPMDVVYLSFMHTRSYSFSLRNESRARAGNYEVDEELRNEMSITDSRCTEYYYLSLLSTSSHHSLIHLSLYGINEF